MVPKVIEVIQGLEDVLGVSLMWRAEGITNSPSLHMRRLRTRRVLGWFLLHDPYGLSVADVCRHIDAPCGPTNVLHTYLYAFSAPDYSLCHHLRLVRAQLLKIMDGGAPVIPHELSVHHAVLEFCRYAKPTKQFATACAAILAGDPPPEPDEHGAPVGAPPHLTPGAFEPYELTDEGWPYDRWLYPGLSAADRNGALPGEPLPPAPGDVQPGVLPDAGQER